MNIVVYDTNPFNQNEWFDLVILLAGIVVVRAAPVRFTRKFTALLLGFGAFTGLCLDHIFGIQPIELYDVNDSSRYELSDFLTYLMYAPFAYIYVYVYDRIGVRQQTAPLYMLLWALSGLVMEHIAVLMGVFHYRNGYSLAYSLPFYLMSQACLLLLYYRVRSSETVYRSR